MRTFLEIITILFLCKRNTKFINISTKNILWREHQLKKHLRKKNQNKKFWKVLNSQTMVIKSFLTYLTLTEMKLCTIKNSLSSWNCHCFTLNKLLWEFKDMDGILFKTLIILTLDLCTLLSKWMLKKQIIIKCLMTCWPKDNQFKSHIKNISPGLDYAME